MSYFAKQLKTLRTQKNWSMQELSDQAGVSKSMICKIENEEVQPTIDVAARLAKALKVTISEMLHATNEDTIIHLKKEDQAVWVDGNQLERRNISPVIDGLKIEWLHITLPAKTFFDYPFSCGPNSSKFLLVKKGHIQITIQGKLHRLSKDESLYFTGHFPHKIENVSSQSAEYYVVVGHG